MSRGVDHRRGEVGRTAHRGDDPVAAESSGACRPDDERGGGQHDAVERSVHVTSTGRAEEAQRDVPVLRRHPADTGSSWRGSAASCSTIPEVAARRRGTAGPSRRPVDATGSTGGGEAGVQLRAQLVGVVGPVRRAACARRRPRRRRRRRAWPGPGSSTSASAYSTAVPTKRRSRRRGDAGAGRCRTTRRPSPPTRRSTTPSPATCGCSAAARIADQAIRVATNAPVNHVAMVVALDDLPPLLWHTELGQTLEDVWTGDAPPRRPAQPARRRLPACGPASTASGPTSASSAARSRGTWRTSCCGSSTLRRQAVPDDRAGWPGGGSRAASASEATGEAVYCAQLLAITFRRMGLLDPKRPSNWYDPGKFWSGDRLELADGASLGGELRSSSELISPDDLAAAATAGSVRTASRPASATLLGDAELVEALRIVSISIGRPARGRRRSARRPRPTRGRC